MKRYALDTDVLGLIQRSGHAATLKKLGPLDVVVTDTVWDELTVVSESREKAPPPNVLSEMRDLLLAIAGTPTVLQPATPESEAYARLHPGADAEDAGEHSLIAYASLHSDVTAVLFDRKALHRAVEELRGRVLSVHGFLDILRTHHGLSSVDAQSISQWVCKAKSVVPPLWWL